MAKVTPRKDKETIVVKTMPDSRKATPQAWWNAGSKKELCDRMLSTVDFLKKQNQQRYRQAAIYMNLYGNLPISGVAGANITKLSTKHQLPNDRPTFSIITSCTDTLVSRITQSRPRPVFLTDEGDYKQRTLAKQMNRFINGELYRSKAPMLMAKMIRDACVGGTGVLKVLKGQDKKVQLERRLATQLLVDNNEAFLGDVRQMYELQLVDRAVLMETFPEYRAMIKNAEQAYPEQSTDNQTVSDQVMIAEGWRLPSGPEAKDGQHVIACSNGLILEAPWEKDHFPFVFLNYSDPQVGFWGDGIGHRQIGNQISINRLLMTIHRSINLVGVPRVFVEDGSKVVKAMLNNEVGSIVTYRGTKPQYEVAPCVPAELYSELQNVINRAYQEEGISQLAAASGKPAGLNSGAALREYDDIQSDRFAALQKRYDQVAIDLAYQIIDLAKEICEEEGSYQTVYPDKNGSQTIDLPASKLLEDPFVIQCFDSSSLPRDPAGRLQRVTEMMQGGLISPQEGRRLLDYPDIEQEERLAIAGEERILKIMDEIVEDGKYTPPDPFMDLAKANEVVVQYYNLYMCRKLSEERAQMLRDFFSQVQMLTQQAAMAMAPQQGAAPQANPMPTPQSELIPNVPGG